MLRVICVTGNRCVVRGRPIQRRDDDRFSEYVAQRLQKLKRTLCVSFILGRNEPAGSLEGFRAGKIPCANKSTHCRRSESFRIAGLMNVALISVPIATACTTAGGKMPSTSGEPLIFAT